jgi:hypothetical protein
MRVLLVHPGVLLYSEPFPRLEPLGLLAQAEGATDAVLRGEGETGTPTLLAAARDPLEEFYRQLMRTQSVINRKHLGPVALARTAGILARRVLHGQPSFARMPWRSPKVYDPGRLYAEHQRPTRYQLPVPDHHLLAPGRRRGLYLHPRAAVHPPDAT